MTTAHQITASFHSNYPPIQQATNFSKIENLLLKLGWKELLNVSNKPLYSDFLNFLYDSRLLFTISGYQQSTQDIASEMNKGIQFFDGQPHLLKEGRWVSWNDVIHTFQYDQKMGITCKGSTAPWNYLYPDGLIQQTRYNWVQAVHQLSQKEQNRLYRIGQLFTSVEKIPEQENCAFLQIVSNGEGFSDRIGGHIGIRLISQTGAVYSLGFEIPKEEASTQTFFSSFGTRNVGINSLDFREFAKFDVRRVTTIPLNLDTFHKLIKKIENYAANPLRINFLHQNCATFSSDILKEAGVFVENTTTSGAEILVETIAPEWVRKTVRTVTEFIPIWVRYIVTVLTFIPFLILTVIKNLFLLALGAGREITPPRTGAENILDNKERLTSFNHLFTNWTDLFKDIPISLPYKISDWQKSQSSTEIHSFEGSKFYIVRD